MKKSKRISQGLIAAAALVQSSLTAQAETLNKAFAGEPYLDTFLGGTTSAARPELAGVVLEDEIQPFSFNGISGTVQNRVVRENDSGTLDFYWRIKVDPALTPSAPDAISAFRLGDFGYDFINDADWRIDGLGSAAPYTGRVFDPMDRPDGAINFLFSDGLVTAGDEGDPDTGSRFYFLHTDATDYAKTATYDLLDDAGGISDGYATFAPATNVPDAGASAYLMLAGLAGLAISRPLFKKV